MTPAISAGPLLEVSVAVGGVAAWLALFAAALVATRPRPVIPAPATQDLRGDEPPAVVNLLANRWKLTEDAAESTLLDLAARRVLELRQPDHDARDTTVHVRVRIPEGLTPYERRVFDRVSGLTVGGTLPLTALAFRDKHAARTWARLFRAEVVADARRRGLSQRRFSAALVSALCTAALVPAGAATFAVAHGMLRTGSDDWGALVPAVLVPLVVCALWARRYRGERDTPAGVEAAARWLGLRTWLRDDESFADLPPAAVAVWDRHLAYGDALGVTRVCRDVIDLGMGDRRRVWSSFGGTWHRVRVRYPRFWPRYRTSVRRRIVTALAALALAALGLAVPAARSAVPFVDPGDATDAVLAALVGYGAYTLVATLVDLVTPVTRTGEALWLQVWKKTPGGEDEPPRPWLHHLAVDDGTGDRTVAWGCPSDLVRDVHCGDVVTLTARRWSRRVVRLEVVSRGRQRALAHAAGGEYDTDTMIGRALDGTGARAARALARRPAPPRVDALLTPEEVSIAVGTAVTVTRHPTAPGPMLLMEEYHTVERRRPVLMAMLSGGAAAQVATRVQRRRGQQLPGIGDEAYAGRTWALARRGPHVVTVRLLRAGRHVPPDRVHQLLSQAVARLPG